MLAVGYDAAILLLAVLSILFSARPGQIDVRRRLPEHLSLGATNQVGWDDPQPGRARPSGSS